MRVLVVSPPFLESQVGQHCTQHLYVNLSTETLARLEYRLISTRRLLRTRIPEYRYPRYCDTIMIRYQSIPRYTRLLNIAQRYIHEGFVQNAYLGVQQHRPIYPIYIYIYIYFTSLYLWQQLLYDIL